MAGDKYIYNNSGELTEKAAIQSSVGTGDAGKIPALDSTGRISSSMMPIGFGDETQSIEASENLAAGDFVNIYNNSGVKVRKADASGGGGKRAHGYVLAAVTAGQPAAVFYGNINSQLSGLTIGQELFLSSTTPGAVTNTAPTTAGYIVQRLGIATATGEALVEIQPPITLA